MKASRLVAWSPPRTATGTFPTAAGLGISGHWIFHSSIFSRSVVGSSSLAFSQSVRAQHAVTLILVVMSQTLPMAFTLKGIETEGCQRGAWALLAPFPRIFFNHLNQHTVSHYTATTSTRVLQPFHLPGRPPPHGFSRGLLETVALRAQGRT